MPRITIQQFRAVLAERTRSSALIHAYRELARRPGLAAGIVHNEWAIWQQESVPATA